MDSWDCSNGEGKAPEEFKLPEREASSVEEGGDILWAGEVIFRTGVELLGR